MGKIGSNSQWKPPYEVRPKYLHVRAPAENFGYVVRARALNGLADYIATIPVRGQWGLDATLKQFTSYFKFYVPEMPLVLPASGCHDTAESKLRGESCEIEKSLQKEYLGLMRSWPNGYARTYCKEDFIPLEGTMKDFGKSTCAVTSAK